MEQLIERLAVVGSRTIEKIDLVEHHIRQFPAVRTIISGGARGVDTSARLIAERLGIEIIEYHADWKRYGRGAGPQRNRLIVKSADGLLAFMTNDSRGTRDTVRRAKELGIPVWEVVVE